MNPTIKAVIGEADMHSPTEREVLDREATTEPNKLKLSGNMRTVPFSPAGDDEPHGEGDMGSPEESKEVELANQILAAAKSNDIEGVVRSAKALVQMHEPGSAPFHASGAGGHVQPVPHPQPPRAGDFGMHSGGV